MPALEQWESYFDAAGIVSSLISCDLRGDAVEFGCGYGTFTIPAAQRILGNLLAIDMDPLMVEVAAARVSRTGLKNVTVELRDFIAQGCGREPCSVSLVLLFNILHAEDPVGLLREAHRVLRPGGTVAMIHWNHDVGTPRGPALEIRPHPQQCRGWGEGAGLIWVRDQALPGSPWHWGMVMARP